MHIFVVGGAVMIYGQRSKIQIWCGQKVKADIWWSRILILDICSYIHNVYVSDPPIHLQLQSTVQLASLSVLLRPRQII